jgi:hypothetical protein
VGEHAVHGAAVRATLTGGRDGIAHRRTRNPQRSGVDQFRGRRRRDTLVMFSRCLLVAVLGSTLALTGASDPSIASTSVSGGAPFLLSTGARAKLKSTRAHLAANDQPTFWEDHGGSGDDFSDAAQRGDTRSFVSMIRAGDQAERLHPTYLPNSGIMPSQAARVRVIKPWDPPEQYEDTEALAVVQPAPPSLVNRGPDGAGVELVHAWVRNRTTGKLEPMVDSVGGPMTQLPVFSRTLPESDFDSMLREAVDNRRIHDATTGEYRAKVISPQTRRQFETVLVIRSNKIVWFGPAAYDGLSVQPAVGRSHLSALAAVDDGTGRGSVDLDALRYRGGDRNAVVSAVQGAPSAAHWRPFDDNRTSSGWMPPSGAVQAGPVVHGADRDEDVAVLTKPCGRVDIAETTADIALCGRTEWPNGMVTFGTLLRDDDAETWTVADTSTTWPRSSRLDAVFAAVNAVAERPSAALPAVEPHHEYRFGFVDGAWVQVYVDVETGLIEAFKPVDPSRYLGDGEDGSDWVPTID